MLNISPSIFWPISALLQIRPFVKLDQEFLPQLAGREVAAFFQFMIADNDIISERAMAGWYFYLRMRVSRLPAQPMKSCGRT